MNRPIYLDHHATTPIDKRVIDIMLPYFYEKFGNASSIDHVYGNEAVSAVNKAREQLAHDIGCHSEEIIFTSGATESDNLAIFGVARILKEKGNHIITCVTEHKAILDSCKQLENEGFNITYLKVNQDGEINLKELENVITPKTIMISIMAANNEVGTIAPLKQIGLIAHKNNILFHTDAAQSFGHIPLNVKELSIDLMSISAHKIGGPKGIGALYVSNDKPLVKIMPLIYGGGHEKGMRSGTLNVPGIVGLGEASRLAHEEMKITEIKLEKLRNKLYNGISSQCTVKINGNSKNKLNHNLNISFENIDAKALINEIKNELAVSTGSACNSNDVKPSHVLLSLGFDEERAFSSIRFGLGKTNTEEQIDFAITEIIKAVNKLSNL
ncbi:aminotransferase class V-fold PLP-dependent enzyme [Candidatus Woesearchaeota archaeon]|nr:MAG: aminotransferase class V-fold PLP-dependent enzyme [Candidatus Woesearchaeota archaeon]